MRQYTKLSGSKLKTADLHCKQTNVHILRMENFFNVMNKHFSIYLYCFPDLILSTIVFKFLLSGLLCIQDRNNVPLSIKNIVLSIFWN